jgi:glycosyltransferase involved in cell wall biosynthesis
MSNPTLVFGIPVFNGELYLRESINSLLAQSYPNIHIVAIDNASTDASIDILNEIAKSDSRLTVFRNDRNLGQIQNIRRAYWEAVNSVPNAEYFALGSDHDLWHPDWATHMISAIEPHPETVLVYPTTVPIDAEGERIHSKLPFMDTVGMSRRERSSAAASHLKGAGVMVYGLFRAAPLGELGVYSLCILPDRLLMLKLALEGEFRHVDKELFFRRYPSSPPTPTIPISDAVELAIQRQRTILFDGHSPWYSRVPWSSLVFLLMWDLTINPRNWRRGTALYGLLMAFNFAKRRRKSIFDEIMNLTKSFIPFRSR